MIAHLVNHRFRFCQALPRLDLVATGEMPPCVLEMAVRFKQPHAAARGDGERLIQITPRAVHIARDPPQFCARDLARADLKLKVAEYFALYFFTIFFGALIFGFIGGRHPVSFLIGAVIGAFAPRFYVKRQQRQRLTRFNDQLSDMLNLMVNGLRAGYSTMQAMEAISRELPSPISDEFRRVVQEMQLGVPMETALDNLLRRIPSDDLDFVITAINVQREVGGNLSEILDSISFTIRERVRIKGEIRVMTAQVRASGSLLSFVPLVLALILWFLNRDYLMSFFTEAPLPWCGWASIVLIIVMIAMG